MNGWPRTLHARLSVGYAAAFFVGLSIFAIISYVSLHSALRDVVDSRLQSTSVSIAEILAADPTINHETRQRIDFVVGSNLNSAVLSQSGRALYSSAVSIAPVVRASVSQAGVLPQILTVRSNSFAARMIVQRLPGNHGSVYVGVWRQLDLIQALEHLRILIFGSAVVLISVSALFVGQLVARQGLRPLRSMAALASEIEAHDLSQRLGLESDSELGQLASTFDRMLERLQDAFERQRQYTADASHELRAPLSVVHLAAELALRRPRDPTAYRRVLASILQATQQLEDLTENLLAAARADGGQIAIERVDLSALTALALEQLLPLAQAKKVRIVASLQPETYVNVDRFGMARATVALVDNAIKFSPEGGALIAAVSREDAHVRLTLHDEGPGFTAEGLEHATDRFWRSSPSGAPGGGSGLGLAICHSVVRASGGRLVPQNADDGGALIVVEFPIAP